MHLSRKRLLFGAGGITAVGAVATLVLGTTLGLFSATPISSGSNSFTAGTVVVAAGTPASVTCSVPPVSTSPNNMVPGDSSTGAALGSKTDDICTYNVKYTGSAPAYLAVDVSMTNGTPVLYDASNNGLQLYLTDGSSTSYLTSTAGNGSTASGAGTTYNLQTSGTSSLTTAGVSNLLVSTTPATTGTAVAFSLNYLLPLSSGNAYQGGSVTVTLTFHAVQSGNQTLPAGCAAGKQCNAAAGFAWS